MKDKNKVHHYQQLFTNLKLKGKPTSYNRFIPVIHMISSAFVECSLELSREHSATFLIIRLPQPNRVLCMLTREMCTRIWRKTSRRKKL